MVSNSVWYLVFMGLTSVGVFGATIIGLLNYIMTRKTHTLVDSTRRDANQLVTKVAYIQGRQDTVIKFIEQKNGGTTVELDNA